MMLQVKKQQYFQDISCMACEQTPVAFHLDFDSWLIKTIFSFVYNRQHRLLWIIEHISMKLVENVHQMHIDNWVILEPS